MNIEIQKLELIQKILSIGDLEVLTTLKKILGNTVANKNSKKQRQYGFAKGMTLHIAKDFDDTPPGFEEYMKS